MADLPQTKKRINTLIISDIHLGLPVSRTDAALRTLQSYTFDRLILNGDIFDNFNLKRLKNNAWNLLSYIRELTSDTNNIEVVWIFGNHDEELHDISPILLGVEAFEEYEWAIGETKYLAIHGHQFDKFIDESPIFTNLMSEIYYFIQRVEGKQYRVSRYLKRATKIWMRNSDKIGVGALAYGIKRGMDYIFCGHTHQATKKTEGGTTYVNSGGWTDAHPTFIIVNDDGSVHLETSGV